MWLNQIRLAVKWRWEDGAGSPCHACHDAAWLRQLRLVVLVGKFSESPTGIVLCAACGEGLKLNDKLTHEAGGENL